MIEDKLTTLQRHVNEIDRQLMQEDVFLSDRTAGRLIRDRQRVMKTAMSMGCRLETRFRLPDGFELREDV